MFKLAARKTDGPNLKFKVQFVLGGTRVGPVERPVKNIDDTWKLVEVTLHAVCGPGDDHHVAGRGLIIPHHHRR